MGFISVPAESLVLLWEILFQVQDSRLLYYLIREIKTWLNVNRKLSAAVLKLHPVCMFYFSTTWTMPEFEEHCQCWRFAAWLSFCLISVPAEQCLNLGSIFDEADCLHPDYLPVWFQHCLHPDYLPVWFQYCLHPDYLPVWFQYCLHPDYLPVWFQHCLHPDYLPVWFQYQLTVALHTRVRFYRHLYALLLVFSKDKVRCMLWSSFTTGVWVCWSQMLPFNLVQTALFPMVKAKWKIFFFLFFSSSESTLLQTHLC